MVTPASVMISAESAQFVLAAHSMNDEIAALFVIRRVSYLQDLQAV